MNKLLDICPSIIGAALAMTGSAGAILPDEIQPEKELLITHPLVVDSKFAQYPGPWSFGTLVSELARGNGGTLVKDWLVIMSAARPDLRKLVVEPWQRRDGYDPKSGQEWLPKLENAPFRLLAIVNRIDLGAPAFVDFRNDERLKWRHLGKEDFFDKLISGSQDGIPLHLQPMPSGRSFPQPILRAGWAGGGGPTFSAGEGRLVFGALDEAGNPLAGGWTVIFEYNLSKQPPEVPGNAARPADPRASLAFSWARSWHALGDLDLTDHRFLTTLEAITRAFTHDGPTLAQLRSNDGATGPDREFRQFLLNNGRFEIAALPGTPSPEFMKKGSNAGRALSGFLREQTPLIRAGLGSLPAALNDGRRTYQVSTNVAHIPKGDPFFHWDLSAPRETRRLFSLMTCNGCHAGETATPTGMHIHPRSEGLAATLSDWLGAGRTGLRIDDPGFKNTRVDLREMQDRKEIMAAFLTLRESKRMNNLRETLRERLSRTH